jgi:hypothetical protein
MWFGAVGGSAASKGTLRAVSIVLILLSIEAVASATSESDQLFEAGVAAFEAGDFPTALGAFEASYALDPVPELLLNIGMCKRLAGDYAGAVNVLRRYVVLTGDSLPQEERSAIERQMEEMGPHVGLLLIDVSESEATVAVDGIVLSASETDFPFAVVPGVHRVEVSKPGFERAVYDGSVGPGEDLVVRLALAPSATPPPTEPDRAELHPAWFWTSLAAAGAFGIVAVGTGAEALILDREFHDATTSRQRMEEIQPLGQAFADTSTAFLVLAGAAAVATAVLATFTDFGDDETESSDASVGFMPVAMAADEDTFACFAVVRF